LGRGYKVLGVEVYVFNVICYELPRAESALSAYHNIYKNTSDITNKYLNGTNMPQI